MTVNTSGLQHVTAIAGDPQCNIDFYVKGLGLRLVKKTVNLDDPSTSTAFSVSEGTLGWWQNQGPGRRLQHHPGFADEERLSLRDPDGLQLDLIASSTIDPRNPWDSASVPAEYAVRGQHSSVLTVANPDKTVAVLTEDLGLRLIERPQREHLGEAFLPQSGCEAACNRPCRRLLRLADDRGRQEDTELSGGIGPQQDKHAAALFPTVCKSSQSCFVSDWQADAVT